MAGRGRAPKPQDQRRNAQAPGLGEWQPTVGLGWQHGPTPEPPDGLVGESRDAWATWMASWFAAFWTPSDLPGLSLVIVQFDAVKRGQAKANDVTTLVRLMDTYGITPAGQQARRWTKPAAEVAPKAAPDTAPTPYAHLRIAQ